MTNPKRVLIIKTGFSEFLDRGISTLVSLGDVLICTSLLHLYKKDHVTWVTSWAARQLLEKNPYIDDLLTFGPATFKKIREKSFDIIINLEKDIGICTYLGLIKAAKRYGFYFNARRYDISTYRRSTQYLLSGQENQNGIHKNIFEILYETVGKKWKQQGPILYRKKQKKAKFDIGFNHAVGSKWPTKAWPQKDWKSLENILQDKFSISWQQGFHNIHRYVDWMDSCSVIVTSDSLGQVLALALDKKVISLYGPTNHRRMEGVKNISVMASSLNCPFRACYLPICRHDKFCMDYISPESVATTCRKLLN